MFFGVRMIELKKCSGLKKAPIKFDGSISKEVIIKNGLHIVGFEFDGTASFRKGTVNGPHAAREFSTQTETYSPIIDKDWLDYENKIIDLGNLALDKKLGIEGSYLDANKKFFNIVSGIDLKKDNVKFLTIGGEHSISYAPIVTYLKQYPDLVLIHLDAHADLRDGYEGYKFSHASIIRRCLDHFGPKHLLIQHGIRSGTKEEFLWMKKNKTLISDSKMFLKKIKAILKTRPIYLTLDVDFFDPACFPGTGTPEAGGASYQDFIKIIKILMTKNFVGADVVELAPNLDVTNNSSVFTTKLLREIILSLLKD